MKNNIPSQEEISARAYQIFVERGCPEGRDLEHWLEAEAQLRASGEQQPANLHQQVEKATVATAAGAGSGGAARTRSSSRQSAGRRAA